ncbi:GNAT family N-acetyltransferase [Kitasatospora kifunensis]|uniref:GNAT superfamily N-acetyltransferase n=1 Tax=Kitasatospora kifunensis TaxID=58351 RepID=A0A7W7W0W2_KITKI|nr:GNAT family N-acetyltransferase [Kitasatospora kifunensis]MBB4929114.1 GNAT superfamily N-acetyltransferase [Kitasatospora kifunensis]
MDASLYRIRALQAADVEAALELMQLANPAYDAQSLRAHRHLLELSCAPAGSGVTDEALRVLAEEMAENAAGVPVDADTVLRQLREKQATGALVETGLISVVAEERATGTVVGLVNAGVPGRWTHQAATQLPEPMVRQLRERVVEVSDIAVAPSARRRGIGQELLAAVLNADTERAQQWRVAMWFFHEGAGAGGFHRAMAPEWPVGQPIAFLDSGREYAPFREMTGDLRACVAPLHPNLTLIMDPTGRPAIKGVFDQPWPESTSSGRKAGTSTAALKRDKKKDKKMRGRARG